MTQRTLAAVIALPLVLALIVLAWVLPLPYTIYRPGPTANVLGAIKIDTSGVKTYPEPAAQTLMTTVNETLPRARNGLFGLLAAWISRDDAIYPNSVAYPQQNTTDQESQKQGQQQMTGAQDTAERVALTKLGHRVWQTSVDSVEKGSPAAAAGLKAGDLITAVGATTVSSPGTVTDTVKTLHAGVPVTLTIERGTKTMKVPVTPVLAQGVPHIGVDLGYAPGELPFDIKIGIDPAIGGPSAGLMMTLAIYDYLTPGSLTGDQVVAGTGEIEPDGTVGPIGGIQQKIPAAKQAGARIFLVPADNCEDVKGADHGSMRLVKVSSFDSALSAIATWTKDPSAALPSCS